MLSKKALLQRSFAAAPTSGGAAAAALRRSLHSVRSSTGGCNSIVGLRQPWLQGRQSRTTGGFIARWYHPRNSFTMTTVTARTPKNQKIAHGLAIAGIVGCIVFVFVGEKSEVPITGRRRVIRISAAEEVSNRHFRGTGPPPN